MNTHLRFTPVDHPDRRISRVGFELDSAYVEQCWTATVGPTSIALLRRMPALWHAAVPAEIDMAELAASLGVGAGTGERSRFQATLERVVQFGLMRQIDDGEFDVYRQVAPLSARQLARAPRWTVGAHERLWAAHVAGLAPAGWDAADRLAGAVGGGVDVGGEPPGGGVDAVTRLTTRLDRLQRPTPTVNGAVGPKTGGLAS